MARLLSLEKVTLSFLALLIAVAGIYAYQFISLLLPGLTCLMLWQQRKHLTTINFRPPLPFIFLFFFLFLGGVGIFWTKAPLSQALHILASTSLTAIFAALFITLLKNADRKTIQQIYTIMKSAGFFLIFLLLSQSLLDFFHFNFFKPFKGAYLIKPSGSILGLAAFAASGFLWTNKEKAISLSTFLLAFFVTYLTNCQTASYGLLLASGIFILSYMAPFWATRFLVIASYTFLLLSTFLLPYASPLLETLWVREHPSFFHRMLGWEFLSNKFLENPFLGWGLGSTPYLPRETNLVEGYVHVIHPHNSSLQAYVELGLGGGILFSLFFSSLFWMVAKYVKDRLSIAVCNATLAFGFIQAEITHSLWHNHWISWVAVLAGLVIVFLKDRQMQPLLASVDHSMQVPAPLKE